MADGCRETSLQWPDRIKSSSIAQALGEVQGKTPRSHDRCSEREDRRMMEELWMTKARWTGCGQDEVKHSEGNIW